jgi:CDP-diacylglycerol--glycerol-3-phosphate 3-phosphatidyltransferase
MNLPNTLTLLRIFFVPLLIAALVQEDLEFRWNTFVITNEFLALAIFLIAAATDLIDGYLARRWGQITTVGTLLDPIADKLLVSAALISLVQVNRLPAWMAILIVGREFAVSGLRSIAAAEGYVIQASDLGKTKTLAQVLAISLLMMGMHWPWIDPIAMLVMWAVVLFAVASAADYFRKFWKSVDDRVKQRRRSELLLMERERQRAQAISRQRPLA